MTRLKAGARWVRWLGLAISIVLIAGVATTAPLGEIWHTLTHVDVRFFMVAALCITLSLTLRGVRWARMFDRESGVTWRHATPLSMIGLAINGVLPGRVGEFTRIGLAATRFRCGIVAATSTVVVERLLDGAALLLMLGGSLLLLPPIDKSVAAEVLGYQVSGNMITGALRGMAIACLVLLIGVVALASRHAQVLATGLVRAVPGLGERAADRVGKIFERVYLTLGSIRRPSTMGILAVYSLVIWMLMAVGNYLVAHAVPGITLSFPRVIALTAITIAASSIPSAPGAWGVFEASGLLALKLLNVDFDEADGVAYMLTVHLSHYIPVTGCGLVAALGEHVSLPAIRQAVRFSQRRRSTTDTPKSGT